MTEDMTKKLYEKYPEIFADQVGFECADGWYMLIDMLCGLLQNRKDWADRYDAYNVQHNEALAAAKAGDFSLYTKLFERADQDWAEANKEKFLKEEVRELRLMHQPVAMQVKEKFGGLRFYMSGGDNECNAYVEFAERISFEICEYCGSTHETSQTKKGWIKTLCSECMRIQEANKP
jgi:hypothetical protein